MTCPICKKFRVATIILRFLTRLGFFRDLKSHYCGRNAHAEGRE